MSEKRISTFQHIRGGIVSVTRAYADSDETRLTISSGHVPWKASEMQFVLPVSLTDLKRMVDQAILKAAEEDQASEEAA